MWALHDTSPCLRLSYVKSGLLNWSLGSRCADKRDFALIHCLSLSFSTYSHILAWEQHYSAALTLDLKHLAIVKRFKLYFFGCITACHNLILIKWHSEAIYSPNWENARKSPNNLQQNKLYFGSLLYRQKFKRCYICTKPKSF